MSYDIGSFVSFFSVNEDFEHINLNLLEEFIDNCTWYEVVGIDVPNDDFITVRSTSQGDDIPVVIDEYLIHTKESLRNHLKSLLKTKEANGKYAEICNKIKQLYRKQEFKFAT